MVQLEEVHSHTRNLNGRNKRCVWKINTKPFKEAHFATYPEKLIEPMIKAGCPEKGIVLDPFFGSGTTAVVAEKFNREWIGIEINKEYIKIAKKRLKQQQLI
jgi:DNA modification methylase